MQFITNVLGRPGESDPACRWIPYTSFVDRDVFITKTGHIGMTLEMEGVEYDTLSQSNLERVSEKFAAAHRVFDERFRLYHHFIKREGERVSRKGRYANPIVDRSIRERAEFLERSGLYSIRLFTTILFEADPVKPAISLSEESTGAQLSKQLAANITILKDAVASYASTLGAVLGISILDGYGIFEHLYLLVNPNVEVIPRLKYAERLDYFAGNTEFQQREDFLDWGGYTARVFSLKEEPDSTFAHMMRAMTKIESNLIMAYEWKRESNLTITRLLRGKRERAWGQRYGATKKAETAIADDAATDKAQRLNKALAQIQAEGNHFGLFSLMAAVFDQDEERLRRAVSALLSCFRDADATLLEERKHRMRSFFAMIPGNSLLNIRYRYLTNRNYADLAPLYRTGSGNEVNAHLDGEYLTVLQSTDGTTLYFNLHVGQVAASLLTGTTGSGKSVLMNQLIEDSQRYEDMRTFIVDVGGSYRSLTKKYGGTYLSVSLKDRNFRINPFKQAYSPRNVNSIKQLIYCFLANEKYETSAEERQEIHEAIHEVYALNESRRRLGKISLRKDLKKALYLWINGGPLSHVFDNEQDDLQANHWSTWDYTDLQESPDVLAPLMYYQLHWINNIVRDPALAGCPKALWCDEGWRFGGSMMADLIQTAAKTWRKHNAWVVFATQDEIDLRNSNLLEVLSSNCHTKIFLPNPGADLGVYGSTFKLTEREQQLLQEMKTGTFLIKTPTESRLAHLRLSKARLEEYGNQFAQDHSSAELQEA
jgi:type IV secretion system protein VirB4